MSKMNKDLIFQCARSELGKSKASSREDLHLLIVSYGTRTFNWHHAIDAPKNHQKDFAARGDQVPPLLDLL